MKTIKLIAWIFLALPAIVAGQEIQQNVIAAAGDHHETAAASISWTIGEVAVETYTGNSHVLSQGFQQGNLTIINLLDESVPEFALKAYPNPVLNKLNVEFEQDKLHFKVVDMNGRVIQNGILFSGSGVLDFEGISSGTYFLVVDQKQTYKIIKQ